MTGAEHVYLVGSFNSPLVKIGRSSNVPRRLASIQSMSPLPLVVLHTYLGGSELEAALHRRFQDRRAHGEWFVINGDPVDVVSTAVNQIKSEMARSPKARSSLPKSPPASHFSIAREVPSPRDNSCFQADPQNRRVVAWPQSGQIMIRPYHLSTGTPQCRCGHEIGVHSPVRPHHCAVDGGHDAEWCTCLGYEGLLPPGLTGYDLPGHNWRRWRDEGPRA
ncbi:GIY-YIG nuclease family protein [Streptomyces sp. NPDC002755]|uniref:GIY-YIG nuclease family protein n=1 Tax=Streptomyces sp. NPDC002884 TaxID=3154544 RepID=UPI00332DCD90